MPARVKKVSAWDREAVLEISRHIWDGYDYLPSVIDEWLRDPDSHIYGVEEDGRLIAVANLRLVDDGNTGWMEGLRVHPDFRGRGYAHTLTRQLIEEAEELGAVRLRYTTSSQNEASLKLAEEYGFVRAFEMAVFWRPTPKTAPPATARRVIEKSSDPAQVYTLLQANPSLIPHEMLVYDWKALDCTPAGFEALGRTNEFYTALKKHTLGSLSYGSLRRRGEVLLWVFTVHATDTRGFLLHLWHNVTIALKRRCNAVMGTHDLKFEEAFQNIDWGPNQHWSAKLVMLEKTMH